MIKKTAIVWIANGFDPDDPTDVDMFSKSALGETLRLGSAYRAAGESVRFVVIKSMVRDPTGTHALGDVLWNAMEHVGVNPDDMEFTEVETTGSPTDGLAVARFAKRNPDTRIIIVACTLMSGTYFQAMYQEVGRYVEGVDFHPLMAYPYPSLLSPSAVSTAIYAVLWFVTALAAYRRWSFLLWYRALNRLYERRKRGFTRTIHAS